MQGAKLQTRGFYDEGKILTVQRVISVFLFFILLLPMSAAGKINGSAGLKIIHAEDDDISQQYFKPFAVLGWSGDLFELSASYYRWIGYSITDELLNSREIDINEGGGEATCYAGDIFVIAGGYSYLSGDSSYSSHKFSGDLMIDLESSDITVDSSFKKIEYDYDGMIHKSTFTAGGEISFDINSIFSWDIGYQHEYTDYKTWGYTYSKNSVRAGVMAVPVKNMYLLGGVTGGADSDDVSSAGLDVAGSLKFFGHLKLTAGYMLTADFISSDSTVSSSSGRRKSTSSNSSVETEIMHAWSVSVSAYF